MTATISWWSGVLEPPRPVAVSTAEAADWINGRMFRLGVVGFQEAMGLPTDGVVGPSTAEAVQRVRDSGDHLSEHFSLNEFRCSHCQRARVQRPLLDLLERLRPIVGPLWFFSSYRCEDHPLSRSNRSSEHTVGLAIDPNPNFPRQVARDCGARGIGYARADNGRCTHVDMGRGDRAPRPAEFIDN